jgi:hypothetical protein
MIEIFALETTFLNQSTKNDDLFCSLLLNVCMKLWLRSIMPNHRPIRSDVTNRHFANAHAHIDCKKLRSFYYEEVC